MFILRKMFKPKTQWICGCTNIIKWWYSTCFLFNADKLWKFSLISCLQTFRSTEFRVSLLSWTSYWGYLAAECDVIPTEPQWREGGLMVGYKDIWSSNQSSECDSSVATLGFGRSECCLKAWTKHKYLDAHFWLIYTGLWRFWEFELCSCFKFSD